MIKFEVHSGIYSMDVQQMLPVSIEEAGEFFSSPANLSKIAPAHMGFQITSGGIGKMYAGQIITYRIGFITWNKIQLGNRNITCKEK